MGLCPKPHNLLKKVDENFNFKDTVTALATGIWYLASGIWRLVTGSWYLTLWKDDEKGNFLWKNLCTLPIYSFLAMR